MQVQYNGQYAALPRLRRGFDSHHLLQNMVDVVQLVRTPDCGSGGRGFKSLHSPHRQTQQIVILLKTLILGLRNVTVISVQCTYPSSSVGIRACGFYPHGQGFESLLGCQLHMSHQLSWIERLTTNQEVGSSSLSCDATAVSDKEKQSILQKVAVRTLHCRS